MAKIPREVYERAGRLAIKEAGGKRSLATDVVGAYMYGYTDLMTASEKYVQNNVMIWTADREMWLKRNGISYRMDADRKFNQIVGKAVNYIVIHYMREHKMEIVKSGNGYKLAKRV